jgi:dipeptidyl aminopeptidase/acylaminoacyl peptidase
MHGLQDRRVPYEQTPHFAKILEKAGVPVRLISINNYVHGPIPGKEPDPSYKTLDLEIDQFFHQHLKENGSRRAPGSVLKRGTF